MSISNKGFRLICVYGVSNPNQLPEYSIDWSNMGSWYSEESSHIYIYVPETNINDTISFLKSKGHKVVSI